MQRRLMALIAALAVLTLCPLALASERAHPQADASQTGENISSVTDANGNPVPLRQNAAENQSAKKRLGDVQRGQAWWPYGSQIAPYNFVDKRAESMTKDEIQVNGVAAINIRDEEATLKLLPRDLRIPPGQQAKMAKDGYYLVKIQGFSRTQEQIDALHAAGATLGEYMNINTYMAKIPATSLAAVKALPFVAYVGDYHPAFKINPRIGLESIPADEAVDQATGREKPWLFEIMLHKGADLATAIDNLEKIGVYPDSKNIVSNDDLTTIFVATTPDNVLAISQVPEVKWISEKSYAHLMASATNPAAIPMLLQNNGVYTTVTANGWKLWNAGIDGTGQIVTMMDSGLNTKMEHFAQDTSQNGSYGAGHRKVIAYDSYGGGNMCVGDTSSSDGGHGTKTSQHAVGSISNMTANQDVTHTPNVNYDIGIARGAKVYFQDIGTDTSSSVSPPTDLGPSIVAAIGKGSFVQNHSWGSSNAYDTQASNLDTALFNNPSMLVTVSSGNSGATGTGTVGSPSTAKNVISVGGNDAANPNSLYINCSWDGTTSCATTDLGSGRGPVVTSGRVKPDILSFIWSSVTVGGEQMAYDAPSAMCQSDATKTVYWNYVNTGNEGGTSFAAPDVAGVAALVRDYFAQGFYPTGTATPANTLNPTGSLVKAVILASGEDVNANSAPTVVALGKRYSSDVGYGRVNVPGVLHIGSSAPFLWVQNGATLGQAATATTFYTINGNAIPLRVMMVWYDAAGNTIVKDADLKVTIGANVYLGNVMSSGWSTTGGTADHTNTTEGVFLDSAHGLPASGTVQVDVIGTNNPGGMNYSLVVTGNVTSTAVTQVSLSAGQYTCASSIGITVNDTGATSPVSVTLTSKNSLSQVIDTKNVSCSGSNGVFNGAITAGSGITVANGGTVTATYGAASPATATINCQGAFGNGGFIIQGGCDNATAGTDVVTGPTSNGGSNEFYTKYMDANEYSSYKFAFVNNTGAALTDATVALSFSGAGASKMTAFNGPIHVGPVAAGATAGGVFQLYTDPSTAGLTPVNLDFDVTSPADGYSTATRITQAQLLQANDTVARQTRCSTFNTQAQFNTWTDSAVNGHPLNPWKWSGSATTPSVVSSENRGGGLCSNTGLNQAAMIGNSAITSGNNFAGNADSSLIQNFQPVLTGNGPNGQPYHYNWAWHSWFHASETLNQTTGVWGIFYNDQWNNPVAPTGTQLAAFTNKVAYYYQTIFDYVGTWNWETANTGTADNPDLISSGAPPNQFFVTFTNVTGLATSSTYFAYGHEHADLTVFTGSSTSSSATTRRDIAFDNDNLVYDEWYATAQVAACGAGTQVGQVSFDQVAYDSCPRSSATISVLDADGVSGLQVTVTSPGTGDSEVVTLTGSAPYFTGTVNLSTNSGIAANDGTLFVLPSETISATYTDTSPAGSSTATAVVACTGADVVYVTNTQVSDNGDNDGIPDNNECVTMDITIRNNTAAALTNVRVQIVSKNSNIDLIEKDHASYGTVAATSSATNSAGDRFTFHVNPAVACSDPTNPPQASFQVLITADGLNGAAVSQVFPLNLDLDVGAGTTSYTQNFTTNPGWTVGITAPDNSGCTGDTYVNNFHWCANCDTNGNGAYGAWSGNSPWGTANQTYAAAFDSSTLYSPIFTAGSTAVTMSFREAARTESVTGGAAYYDGAIVQYQLGAGAWTTLAYTSPAQIATTTSNFCSPILATTAAWGGTAAASTVTTVTNAASVTTTNGQSIQFRWRLGSDSSGLPSGFGGYLVDDVTVTGLRQFVCEPTRPGSAGACCLNPSLLVNNTAVDIDLCLATGVRITWAQDPDNWGDGGSGTRTYDVLRNGSPIVSGLSYGTTTYTDSTGTAGQSYSYTVRYNNGCTGSQTTAGANAADAGNVVCNDGNVCTNDACNPATGLCVFTNNTASCSDGNACTVGDTCSGGSCQPGTPTVCNDNNPCTNDSCDTGTGLCVYTNNTASCNDGNACTTNDTCSGGTCVGGAALNCDDSNPCTDDSCNPATGCVHTNNTASCNDGNACTTNDTCSNGSCVGGTALNCDDSNVCTTDSCNPATGCVHTNNTASCNDGNACTTNDTCSNGSCVGGAALNCNDNNPCTDDSCNPATGCVHVNNTASCNDGNACTTNDTCSNGSCVGGAALNCDDSNPCTDDSCNPATGCVHTNNTASCDDGNACTTNDTCSNGSCVGGAAPNCNDNNPCTDDACNPATGCTHTNNTASCDDGNACTVGDFCGGGVCHAGTGTLNCDDNNVCTDDACNPATGCTHTNNTASCDDGNYCTTGDTCQNGVCNPGTGTLDCNDDNVCTDDSCNPATGCVHTNNTASCDDGNACTTGDTCSGGSCQPGTGTLDCDDHNPCTDDSCNPATGCVYTNNTGPCDDGNACTTGDYCGGGTCHSGVGLDCNDNNPCTDDSCDVQAQQCIHTNNTASCNDGNACTVGDVCGGGTCHPGTGTLDCNDNNVCTDDSCNPATGCVHTNNTASCSDGNACTTGDVCGGGTCHAGTGTLDCNDNNPCTNDSCNPATGCVHTNNTASCDDGNACTTNDTCSNGSCVGGAAPNCDDNNPCTDDSCNPATGCQHVNNTASCDDGNACTTNDTCSGGSCHGGAALNCNDNNGCTDDSCNPATGCQHANNTASCDDGNACTVGDTCGGGTCHAGTPLVCNDNNVCTDDSCNPGTGCVFLPNTGACDDGNVCTAGDFCGGGTCHAGSPVPPPGEAHNVVANDKTTYSWSPVPGATQYDVLRGSTGAFPVGPGGADETCFDNLGAPTVSDPALPPVNGGFWYLSRGESVCGNGTYGNDSSGSPRVSTTCP